MVGSKMLYNIMFMLAERISRYTSFESFFYITLQHLLNPKEKGYEKKNNLQLKITDF